jgi:glycosyltransferase involved in cell wall biosynthesis
VNQSYQVNEIITIDSSDEPLSVNSLKAMTGNIPLRLFHTKPSVCNQRNMGIRAAQSEWVLLCDDDVTFPPDYISGLVSYTAIYDPMIVSGLFTEKIAGIWQGYPPAPSAIGLLWRWWFQLGVWANLSDNHSGRWYTLITALFGDSNDGLSLAGWPVITDFSKPVVRCAVYSLGAALVRREVLMQNPFEQVLDPHGYGDNYGVTTRLPELRPVHVLTSLQAFHHRAIENRNTLVWASYRRTLALHYFLKSNGRFGLSHRLFFVWSIIGLALLHLSRFRIPELYMAWRVLITVVFRRNPFVMKTASSI